MGRGPELPEVQHGGSDSLTANPYTGGEMNEQEARAELIANIYDVESVLPYIDRYRDSILAAQPCYRSWMNENRRTNGVTYMECAEMPDVIREIASCHPCQARERMKVELTTV